LRIFIVSGFAEPIGYQSLQWLKALGVSGIRQDIPWGAPVQYRERLIAEVAEAHMDAVWILGGGMSYAEGKIGFLPDNWRPSTEELCKFARDFAMQLACYPDMRSYIELGNETNLQQHGGPLYKDPELFAKWLHYVPEEIWSANDSVEVISGGFCGLHKRSLKYFKRAFDTYFFPRKLIIGFHPYRTDKTFDESVEETVDAFVELRRIIGNDRPVAVTEIGWHTAPQKTNALLPCRRKEFRFSDDDVADFAESELRFWQRMGAKLLSWYQLNCGPNEFYGEDQFGIRDIDGRRKPVANAIKRYLRGAAA
jgi:hypothetical protein